MDVDRIIRKLARQMKYRLLVESKMSIFANTHCYSDIQMKFLNYIYFYQSLFTDISLGDVDEAVIKDVIYEDAYSYYKSIKKNKEKPYMNYQPDKTTEKVKQSSSQWVFKTPRKKVK